MSSNAKIRVGLIRCDGHGLYFGALAAPHDPLQLQMPIPREEFRAGAAEFEKYRVEGKRPPLGWTINFWGTYYYFYSQYSDPTRINVPTVEGMEIAKLWDANPRAARCAAKLFLDRPVVCDRYEQVSDDVDVVFIADCNFNGEDHLELATPGLKKGVPTFVDKPFARTVRDAKRILALGDRHGAPVLSLSIMRTTPAATRFAQRLPELHRVDFATVQGFGDQMNHLVHVVSLVQHIFGDAVESVRVTPGKPLRAIHLSWGNRPDRPTQGVTLNINTGALWHGSIYVSAFGPGNATGVIHSGGFGDWEHPYGAAVILEKIKEMVKTRRAPAPRDQMLEIIAVCEAIYRAHETGREVPVREILKESDAAPAA